MITAVETEAYVLSKDVVQRRVGNHIATYHRLLGGLFFLDGAAQDELRNFRQPRQVPSKILFGEADNRIGELTQQLIARRILVRAADQDATSAEITMLEKKVNIIQLILANACNFGCTYC